jgi:hypothetical protein
MASNSGFTEMELKALNASRGVTENAVPAEMERVNFSDITGSDQVNILPPPGAAPVTPQKPQEAVEENTALIAALKRVASGESAPQTSEKKKEDDRSDKKHDTRPELSDTGIVRTCPRCSWDCSKPVTDAPDQSDKEEFVRSILGSRPFKKKFSFLKGKLEITLRSISVLEEAAVFKELTAAQSSGIIKTPEEWHWKHRVFRIPAMLAEIAVEDSVKRITDDVDSPRQSAYDKLSAEWGVALQAFVGQAQVAFDEIYIALMIGGMDRDF